MITASAVLAYVGGSDTQFAQQCLNEANELVRRYAGQSLISVPDTALDRAILEVSSELWHRRNAPSGIVQFAGVENPVRINKDPMTSAYPILNKWIVGM